MTARGFTLLEILVAISIAAVLLALATVSFRGIQGDQEVKQAGQTLISNLRFAQSQAYGGVKPCGNETLTGWFVTFGQSSYTLNAKCGSTVTSQLVTQLPVGVTINSQPDLSALNKSVLFRPINKEVGLINQSGVIEQLPSDIIITLDKQMKIFNVVIKKSGDISEQ